MVDTSSAPYDDFDGVYAHSREFPSQALAAIPEHLVRAVDGGNREFFAPIEIGLPVLHSVLVDHCTPVRLLELVPDPDDDIGEEGIVYQWGLDCGGRLIICNIPMSPRHLVERRRRDTQLPCLPDTLHGCHATMDGMAMVEYLGPPGFDLPSGAAEWTPIADYCEDHGIPLEALDRIRRDFGTDDLRVYVEGSRGDLVLLNYTRKQPTLYHVSGLDFDRYAEVRDMKSLDAYFGNAVLGFPKQVKVE